MFPTREERYYRYVAWCVLLEVQPLEKDAYFRELAIIPEHTPIGGIRTHDAAHYITTDGLRL